MSRQLTLEEIQDFRQRLADHQNWLLEQVREVRRSGYSTEGDSFEFALSADRLVSADFALKRFEEHFKQVWGG